MTTISRTPRSRNCGELTEITLPDATEAFTRQNAFAEMRPKLAKDFVRQEYEDDSNAYCFTRHELHRAAHAPCWVNITCRATTPPTLKDDYGTGPFGGSWYDHAGKDVPAENRVIHLPKSTDPVGGTGAYADSSWAELAYRRPMDSPSNTMWKSVNTKIE